MIAPDKQPTYEELLAEVLYLREELASLKRLVFGQKRERYVAAANEAQLELGLDIEAKAAPAAGSEHIEYSRKKPAKPQTPHSRQALPAHLPRRDIVIEPEEDVNGLRRIGEEITEELEYQPGELYVNRYIRPKYARGEPEGVIIARLPSRPIEKGIPGPGLLAQILIGKYVDHLPLYRQINQFKRLGIELAASTICGWVKGGYELLLPLNEVHFSSVFESDYLIADETPIQVLDESKKGRSHKGYYWVYYDPVEKEVYFDYRQSRSRDGPNEMLKDFSGYLQSDGYSGYDDTTSRKNVIPLGCFAHARRYYHKAKDSDPKRAEWMLRHIQQLYRVERKARKQGLSYEERYDLRQANSRPVLDTIKDWLDTECLQVLPKSVMGKAIGYSLNQWPKLQNYLLDGRLEIDNNLVENAIRPVALGRKNYLFAGSHEGGKRGALVYSLVATAKLQGVEPFEYMKDIIGRIADYPHKQIADLLPANWKEKFKK
jgi:transposase